MSPRTAPPLVALLAMLAALTAAPGCYRTSWQNAQVTAVERRHTWEHTFVLGTIGGTHRDLRDLCGARVVASVSVHGDVGTVVLSVVTAGLYTPRRVTVQCGSEVRQ